MRRGTRETSATAGRPIVSSDHATDSRGAARDRESSLEFPGGSLGPRTRMRPDTLRNELVDHDEFGSAAWPPEATEPGTFTSARSGPVQARPEAKPRARQRQFTSRTASPLERRPADEARPVACSNNPKFSRRQASRFPVCPTIIGLQRRTLAVVAAGQPNVGFPTEFGRVPTRKGAVCLRQTQVCLIC